MPNSNVPNDFDKTVYDFDTFAKVEITKDYGVIMNPCNHDLIQIGKELGLPKGSHLVKLTVTAEVMKSELPDPTFFPPTDDDLAQEHMAEQMAAVFEQSNGKIPVHSGVTDLF